MVCPCSSQGGAVRLPARGPVPRPRGDCSLCVLAACRRSPGLPPSPAHFLPARCLLGEASPLLGFGPPGEMGSRGMECKSQSGQLFASEAPAGPLQPSLASWSRWIRREEGHVHLYLSLASWCVPRRWQTCSTFLAGGAGTSSALWDAGAVPALTARCPHSCAPSRDASRAPTSCLSRLLEAAHILWPVALSQRCRDATLACHTLLPATLSRGPCADPGSLGPSRVISYLLNLTPAQSLLPLRSPACTGGSDVLALGHRLGSPGRCPRGSGAAAVCPSGPVLCVAPACCTDRPQVAPGLGTEETHPPPPSRPAVCTALGPRL